MAALPVHFSFPVSYDQDLQITGDVLGGFYWRILSAGHVYDAALSPFISVAGAVQAGMRVVHKHFPMRHHD